MMKTSTSKELLEKNMKMNFINESALK